MQLSKGKMPEMIESIFDIADHLYFTMVCLRNLSADARALLLT
jgi:hypothetical protein